MSPAIGRFSQQLAIASIAVLLLPAICSFAHAASAQHSWMPAPLDEAAVRAVLGKAMRCQNLPQLHAAVVHGGRQLHSFQLELMPNGSVADIGRRVLLPIASLSKGMFATALPIVQDQLRKDKGDQSFNLLTTPIKQLLGDKDFWFLDHVRSDAVTIEDLVSHTTGLTRHDSLSIWSGVKSKAELVQRAGRFNATGTFRGSFIYNNLVWTMADYTVERLTGKNFSAYMRQFLWQPLGMSGTLSSSEMDGGSRVQRLFRSPKHFRSGRVPLERTELEKSLDLVEAAGGIYVPLDDMVKYMQHHTRSNYSSSLPPPAPFKAVNAFVASTPPFDPRLFNSSVTDLPDMDRESYGHGWVRSWYRDNLAYEHSGSFFGAHCNLRVLPKSRLSVFTHTSLGQSDSVFQSGYAEILNHYLTDMLLRNASFVTLDNVCSLFSPLNPGEPVAVPKRRLTDADREICVGSFGNYGFGTLSVAQNATSGLLNAAYGTGVLEMQPIQLPQSPPSDEYGFLLTILHPSGFPLVPPIVGANDTHVMVHAGSPDQTPLRMRIARQPDGRVLMISPALDQSAVLEKGLRPGAWRRPELCPPAGKGAAAAVAAPSARWGFCCICWSLAWLAAVLAARVTALQG